MAGALRKTMIYLGLADGDEHYESGKSVALLPPSGKLSVKCPQLTPKRNTAHP